MVSVTITYRQAGTQPPIFVAGSFSDPQWTPQEMQFTTEEGGEHTFFKIVEVPANEQIQYKFRVGLGDWWILNETAATVTDDAGNRNNVLTAPASQELTQLNGTKADSDHRAQTTTHPDDVEMNASDAAASHSTAQLASKSEALGHLRDEDRQRLSSTPIEQVAETAAQVADTAKKLDEDDGVVRLEVPSKALHHPKDEDRKRLSSTPIEQVASTAAEVADTAKTLDADQDIDDLAAEDDGPPPLFTHEALGPYEPPSEDEEDDTYHHGTVEYDVDKYDLNDPALERLPSNRNGIINTVRKVETGRNEDQTYFHGSPMSPVVGSARPSSDPYEEAILSPGPSSPGPSSKRLGLPRKSHGSMTSERSLASLGSIVEEDKDQGTDEATRENAGLVRVPSPAVRPTPNVFGSPASDEDEGVVMKGSKSKSKKSTESDRADSPGINGISNGKHSRDLSPKSQPSKLDGPSIHVQPPEEVTEAHDAGEAAGVASSSGGKVSATGRDDGHKGQLKKRGGSSSSVERPGTPSSIHSVADSKGGWLQAFFRVLFVDWIGGLFNRLFGSKRKAMLTTSTAAIVVGLAWWKFALHGDLSWLEILI